VLAGHGFPAGEVFFRQPGESYAGVAQTAQASLAATPGRAVRCLLVPEFGGLAHLPDDPGRL
jgi:hypothetical protein